MLNTLYNGFASYYAVITNDRDFTNQMKCILNTYDLAYESINLLELFAGQSVHSIEALTNYNVDAWAIDSSIEMKQLALDGGFRKADQYIIGNLPEAILDGINDSKFDCVLALFNGICNLNTTELYKLLYNIKQVLKPNGKVYIEIQDVFYMMEYVGNPGINFQEAVHPNGDKITYAWPSDRIKWDRYSFVAAVPVKMIINSEGETYTKDFISIDRIHSTEVVFFIAGLHGFKCRVLTEDNPWRKNFEYEILLELSL